MAKIGLVDADLLDGGTKHPNLCIMKLSGYYKEMGYEVELIENVGGVQEQDYEKIFVSKVFNFTKVDERVLGFKNVVCGGTGFFFDKAPDLPYEIEHHMPDYHIYDNYIAKHPSKNKSQWKDYQDYSIGFATRGCFRKCKFCVNRKYDRTQFHSHIREWYDPDRKYIYLWDDNIFAYSKWREVFQELLEINKPFQFKQGLDIRLLTREKAEILNKCKYHGDIIFAFDHIEDRELIEKKLKLWRSCSFKPTKLYVLSGFEGIDENEIISVFERIKIIMTYGCLPYIMRHENYLNSPYKGLFIQLARWCNQPGLFKKKSFREFCELTQSGIKTKGKLCSAMVALKEFEEKFPDIARKYFDLKFEEVKITKKGELLLWK